MTQRLSMAAAATIVTFGMAFGGAPQAQAGQTWGGNGYVDYYGFCYILNRNPDWRYTTLYAGATMTGSPGSGVVCKARTWNSGAAFAIPARYDRFYSWNTMCILSGWRGGLRSVTKNGTLFCKN